MLNLNTDLFVRYPPNKPPGVFTDAI